MNTSGFEEPHVSDHIRHPMSITPVAPFTDKQGQYLAFIYLYTKLHRQPPAEADIQKYFGVTPPSVHTMIVTLEKHGLIRRQPGRARTIEVLVPAAQLPDLR
jgi:DNA-binding MarR family transcriptional regulator